MKFYFILFLMGFVFFSCGVKGKPLAPIQKQKLFGLPEKTPSPQKQQ